MAEYTENYNLKKPSDSEFYSIEDFNDNADIIDAELKNLKNTIENLNADGITLPDGKTISEKFEEIETEIGNIEELDTDTKTNVIAAINEIFQALVKQMPISGGEFTGIVKAYPNTSYTVAQLRNIILSPEDPDVNIMNNGDIWIKYE